MKGTGRVAQPLSPRFRLAKGAQSLKIEYRILNTEYRISKCFNFIIRHSLFDIRYSYFKGKGLFVCASISINKNLKRGLYELGSPQKGLHFTPSIFSNRYLNRS
jgi:hypothetical protein